MRALIRNVPESLIDERRRTGADRWDEMWNGVLHMAAFPSGWHQRLGTELLAILLPIAKARGLLCSYETAVHRPGHIDQDYRGPDLVFYRPEVAHERGVVGAPEVVVEILSPDDETYEKLPWYAELGTREVLVIDPDSRRVELFILRGSALLAVQPDAAGAVRSDVLGVTFARVEGPKLRVSWSQGTTEL